MTCDLYFQMLLCNDSLKVMSVIHCSKAHMIIPFIIHMINWRHIETSQLVCSTNQKTDYFFFNILRAMQNNTFVQDLSIAAS